MSANTTEIKSFQMTKEQAEGLLDYYAAAALNGLIVKSPFLSELYKSKEDADSAAATSECLGLQRFLSAGAFGYAKAMMAERVLAMEWLADCQKLHSENEQENKALKKKLAEDISNAMKGLEGITVPASAQEGSESENNKEAKFQKLLARLNELSVENKALRNKVTDVTNRWARLNEQDGERDEEIARLKEKEAFMSRCRENSGKALDELNRRLIELEAANKRLEQANQPYGPTPPANPYSNPGHNPFKWSEGMRPTCTQTFEDTPHQMD